MNTLLGYATVFVGAGIGGSLRHAVNRAAASLGFSFASGTLVVNVLGSLVMGWLAGWLVLAGDAPARSWVSGEAGQQVRLFLTTGVLGGFTTFSAFSLDAVLFLERGKPGLAVLYAVASVALSVGGLIVGLAVTRA